VYAVTTVGNIWSYVLGLNTDTSGPNVSGGHVRPQNWSDTFIATWTSLIHASDAHAYSHVTGNSSVLLSSTTHHVQFILYLSSTSDHPSRPISSHYIHYISSF